MGDENDGLYLLLEGGITLHTPPHAKPLSPSGGDDAGGAARDAAAGWRTISRSVKAPLALLEEKHGPCTARLKAGYSLAKRRSAFLNHCE